ncbi:hypothetical protein [Hyphobacterium sp.]|uniref:hypothetical protein n=1 Tax=Hyphobacterium sp. TaxID=2004662 RepID=UPI003748906D
MMLESLIFAAVLSQASIEAQSECTAVVDRVEVRRAVRAGQAQSIISAAELVDQCAGREELLVLAAQTAWEEQNLAAVSLLSSSALRLIGDRGCAWTPLAARLAFATGFSRRAIGLDGDEFYFFVAQRVHNSAGGLRDEWRFVAQQFAEDFGTYPPDDIFAFGSPYIASPYRIDDDRCGGLPEFFIRFDASTSDTAYAVFDIETDRDGDIRRSRLVLSYPGDIPREVQRALRGRRSHDIYFDGYHLIEFGPCIPSWFIVDDESPICLQPSESD